MKKNGIYNNTKNVNYIVLYLRDVCDICTKNYEVLLKEMKEYATCMAQRLGIVVNSSQIDPQMQRNPLKI